MNGRSRIAALVTDVLTVATGIMMAIAIYLVFVYVPTERIQGVVQRIFYFHVPAAWSAFTGFLIVAIASALFLWRGGRNSDLVAHAAAEVGLLFCTMVLVTGPIWARPIWGVWWTWDPRLTMTLVLWTIYATYLVLRMVGRDDPLVARYAAVLGIVGAAVIPFILLAVRLWNSIHPSVISARKGQGGLGDPRMVTTLIFCGVTFLTLFSCLLWRRFRVKQLAEEIADLRDELEKSSGRANP